MYPYISLRDTEVDNLVRAGVLRPPPGKAAKENGKKGYGYYKEFAPVISNPAPHKKCSKDIW